CIILSLLPPPQCTLFPYTTLFRSGFLSLLLFLRWPCRRSVHRRDDEGEDDRADQHDEWCIEHEEFIHWVCLLRPLGVFVFFAPFHLVLVEQEQAQEQVQ